MSDLDSDFVDVEGMCHDDIADQQFVHGLLESARCDTDEAQRHRMARVVSSISQAPVHGAVAVKPRARRLGAVAMMAAALTVVVIFVIIDRVSATDMVAYLSRSQPVSGKVAYKSIGPTGTVYGQIQSGVGGQRLLSVRQEAASTDCLLIRGKDGVCLFRNDYLPHVVEFWPEWVRVDRLITPIKTPSEWLWSLRESHTFDYRLGDGKQVIVGTRRSEIVDPLVPMECEIWLDHNREQLVAICLQWMPAGYVDSGKGRSADAYMDYFKRLDVNHDGKVGRVEAAGDWSLFASLGFGDRQLVTLQDFCDLTGADTVSGSVELLSQSTDLIKYQPPASLVISLQGIEDRPPWLFEKETFRRR